MEMEVLPNAVLLIISFLSPFLVSIFTKTNMSSRAKNWVSAGVALLIGIGYSVFTGGITDWSDVGQILQAAASAFAIQQLAYRQLLLEQATKVEAKYGVGSKESFVTDVEVETEVASDGSEVVVADGTSYASDVDTHAKG